MITPVELGTIMFRRSMRGYKVAEVQAFMTRISADYEYLYRENKDLVAKLEELQSKLDQYIQKDDTLRNALILAQETADEQINTAKLKADIIVREAQFQAEQIRSRAKDDIQMELQKLSWLKTQVDLFKCQFKSFLNGLLETAEQELNLNIIWDHIQKNNPNAAAQATITQAVKEAAATSEPVGPTKAETSSPSQS